MLRRSRQLPLAWLLGLALLVGALPTAANPLAAIASSTYKVQFNLTGQDCNGFSFNVQQLDTVPLDVRVMLGTFQVWRDGAMAQGTQYPPANEHRDHRHDFQPGDSRDWALVVGGKGLPEETVASGHFGLQLNTDMSTTGPGGTTTATFHNADPVCGVEVGNSSYGITTRPGSDDTWIKTQFLFQSKNGVVPASGDLTLTVANPNCAFQTDSHLGGTPAVPPFYGDRLLKSVVDSTSPPLCSPPTKSSTMIWLPWVTLQKAPVCPALDIAQFGWGRDNITPPTTWYKVGDAYPTQRPGAALWMVLVAPPEAGSYYVLARDFQPANSALPIQNWGEIYPGANGGVPLTFLVHADIPPGYVHTALFYRSHGLDCEVGQAKFKVDDNGPASSTSLSASVAITTTAGMTRTVEIHR